MSLHKMLPVLGAGMVLLVFLAWMRPVLAVEPGLVRTYEYSKVYWVDRFGISHYVPDTQTQRLFFGDSPVNEIAWSDFINLPKGGPITHTYPPEFYNTAKTRVVVSTVPAATPVVEERRTVTRLDTGLGAAPIVTERRVETVVAPTVVEKRVEVVPPTPVEQHVEIVQQPVVEKRVTVTAPTVVERRVEVTSPAVVERTIEIK